MFYVARMDFSCHFLIFAQLDLTKILKPFAPPKNSAKSSYIKKFSNHPPRPKKVRFGSLIFLENIIFRPENALAERALQNSQTIRTSQTGRLITIIKVSVKEHMV